MAFVDILVYVLDRLHGEDRLHIDMTLVAMEQPRRVSNHPAVIKFSPTDIVLYSIILSTKDSIGILRNCGGITKGFGKSLGTLAINHAWRIGMIRTTWAMNHMLDNSSIKFRLLDRIWELSRKQVIHIIRSV